MSLDLSTLLGVLGVILTVLFFVVGYRQTIGARKERAHAANKVASDALFRRLTLEEKFDIDVAGINRLLRGWALDARIRPSDMYSSEELHAILACRTVDSDYLSGDQRKEIIRRLDAWFKQTQTLERAYSPLRTYAPRSQVTKFGTEVVLAAASGATALVATIVAAFVSDTGTLRSLVDTSRTNTLLELAGSLGVLIALTGVALTLFTRLRETTGSTDEDQISSGATGAAFEQLFIEQAKQLSLAVEIPKVGWPDLAYADGSEKIAIQLKYRLSMSWLRTFISEIERRRAKDGFSRVYIVSPSLRQSVRRFETAEIKFYTPSDALRMMSAAALHAA